MQLVPLRRGERAEHLPLQGGDVLQGPGQRQVHLPGKAGYHSSPHVIHVIIVRQNTVQSMTASMVHVTNQSDTPRE